MGYALAFILGCFCGSTLGALALALVAARRNGWR